MTLRFSLGIPRFFPDANGYSRIIQCAEALWRAPDVLSNTYTNCAWQHDLLDQAEAIAAEAAATAAFGHALDPVFAGRYPATRTVVTAAGNPMEMAVAPFHFLSSHEQIQLRV